MLHFVLVNGKHFIFDYFNSCEEICAVHTTSIRIGSTPKARVYNALG